MNDDGVGEGGAGRDAGCFMTHVQERVCEPDEHGVMRCRTVRKVYRHCPGDNPVLDMGARDELDLFDSLMQMADPFDRGFRTRFFNGPPPSPAPASAPSSNNPWSGHSHSPFSLFSRDGPRQMSNPPSYRKSEPAQWRTYSEYQSETHEI